MPFAALGVTGPSLSSPHLNPLRGVAERAIPTPAQQGASHDGKSCPSCFLLLGAVCGTGQGPHLICWVGSCLSLVAATVTQAAFFFFSPHLTLVCCYLGPEANTNRPVRKPRRSTSRPEAQGLKPLPSAVPLKSLNPLATVASGTLLSPARRTGPGLALGPSPHRAV